MKNTKKGFTLIELLIVIGILAVLAVLTVLVLNPGQLFAQARDSQRLADFRTLQSAINYYMSTAGTPAIANAGPFYSTTGGTAPTVCPFSACGTQKDAGTAAGVVVTGTGWVGINLSLASGGAPLAKLPADPINDTVDFYGFKGDATNVLYEIDARLESGKYRALMGSDGGDKSICSNYLEPTCWYEVGTSLTL